MKNHQSSHLTRIPHSSIEDRSKIGTSLTWSLHELQFHLTSNLIKVLVIDVGMFSWSSEVIANNNKLHIDPKKAHSNILTHTHNDHSGKEPVFVKEGYDGPIHMTQESHAILPDILEDSLYVQEQDSVKTQKQRKSFGSKVNAILWKSERTIWEQKLLDHYDIVKNSDIKRAQDEKYGLWKPLFSADDIDKTLSQIVSHPYADQKVAHKFNIFNDTDLVQARFLDAWHLYGSAMVLIEVRKKNSNKIFNILRWGDMGRFGNRIYGNIPTLQGIKKQLDLVFLESTYWGRNHPDIIWEYKKIIDTTKEVFTRWWIVVKAEFAQDRLPQSVLSDLKAIDDGELPEDTVVVIDSKLVKKLVVRMSITNPEYRALFKHPNILWLEKDETEKLLLTQPKNHIFHMSWGMLQGGTIMKIIKYFDKQWKDIKKEYHWIAQNGLVLLSGYTPEHTLWYEIKNNPNRYNSESVNLSGHIDHNGIIDFITNKDGLSWVELRKDAKICFMHWEIGSMYKLKDSLVEQWIDEKNIIVPVSNGSEFNFPL